MAVKLEETATVDIIEVTNRSLEMANAVTFKQSLNDLNISQDFVLIDISAVHFMDSSGLGALFFYTKKLKGQHKKVAIIANQPEIEILFNLVRIRDVLSIYKTRQDALADPESW